MRTLDDKLVRALTTLLSKYGPHHEHTRLRAWESLRQDIALAAFFISVEDAGEDAWDEERMRVARRFVERTRHLAPEFRQGMTRTGAVRSLLPLWRNWGQMLVQRDARS